MDRIIVFVDGEPCEIKLTPQQIKQISNQRKTSERKDFFQKKRILRNIERQAVEICKPIDYRNGSLVVFQNQFGNIELAKANGLILGAISFDTEAHAKKILKQFRNEIEEYFDICQRRYQECSK